MNSHTKKQIPIELIEQHYSIEPNGSIFSIRKQKYLKPTLNTAGYQYVMLSLPHARSPLSKMYGVHRLIACKHIGQCPPWKETSHKDGNKTNNHYTNLEYLSHSENILKSFREHGRTTPKYLHQPTPDYVRTLMSNAKKKRVRLTFDGMEAIFTSMDAAAQSLNTYRKKIYRCVTHNIPFSDKQIPNFTGILSFVEESRPV